MKNYTDLYIDSPKAFLRKLEEDIKAMEANLSRLEAITASSVGRLLEEYKAYGVPVADQWAWTADANDAGFGNLYAPELGKGQWFCWTGPSAETKFVVPVRRDVTQCLRIACGSGPGLEDLASLRVFVDGQAVPTQKREDGLEVRIGVRDRLSALPTVVVIDTLQTVKPGNGDERELGIALFGLSVEPLQSVGTASG